MGPGSKTLLSGRDGASCETQNWRKKEILLPEEVANEATKSSFPLYQREAMYKLGDKLSEQRLPNERRQLGRFKV